MFVDPLINTAHLPDAPYGFPQFPCREQNVAVLD